MILFSISKRAYSFTVIWGEQVRVLKAKKEKADLAATFRILKDISFTENNAIKIHCLTCYKQQLLELAKELHEEIEVETY